MADQRDVIYFLKADLPLEGVELRYSLRSLRNMPHGKVWMCTPALPEWVNPAKVGHIEWSQQGTKYDDLGAKWLASASWDFLPNKIVCMDDDMYIIRPIKRPAAKHNMTLDMMLKVSRNINENVLGTYDFYTAIKNCVRKLQEQGIKNAQSPVQHIPFTYERSRVPVHWADDQGPYDWKTLVYNHRNPKQGFMKGEPKTKSIQETKRILERGDPFLSSDDGWKFFQSGMRRLLANMFPEPSKYEL